MPVTHSRDTAFSVADPLRTITTAKGGETALSAATLIQVSFGERQGQSPRAMDIEEPLGTVVAGGIKHAVASAYLVQAGHGEGSGATKRRSYGVNDIQGPVGTITASAGGQSAEVADLSAKIMAARVARATPAKPAPPKVVPESQLRRRSFSPPVYPDRARERGTEGWVDLEYTVASDGSTRDIVVRAAEPAGTFDSAAVNAVKRWRYEPLPADQRVEARLRFRLSE